MVWSIMAGAWTQFGMVRTAGKPSQRAPEKPQGKLPINVTRFVFLGLLAGGQEGIIPGVRFSRPFAPCFARLVVVSDVHLLTTSTAFDIL
jgi:hypothetical protein